MLPWQLAVTAGACKLSPWDRNISILRWKLSCRPCNGGFKLVMFKNVALPYCRSVVRTCLKLVMFKNVTLPYCRSVVRSCFKRVMFQNVHTVCVKETSTLIYFQNEPKTIWQLRGKGKSWMHFRGKTWTNCHASMNILSKMFGRMAKIWRN